MSPHEGIKISDENLELQKVRTAVVGNFWPAHGRFNFEASVLAIANALSVEQEIVRESLKEAVTKECLTKVTLDNEKEPRPLLELLGKAGFEIYLWTLGDGTWQREKIQRSGAIEFIKDTEHIFVAEGEKVSKLKEILDKILTEHEKRPLHVYVVDDSATNITAVQNLAKEYKKKGVELHNYHLKLADERANATAFYQYILEEQIKNPGAILVLDFDQVVADTDGTLSLASENIFKSMNGN